MPDDLAEARERRDVALRSLLEHCSVRVSERHMEEHVGLAADIAYTYAAARAALLVEALRECAAVLGLPSQPWPDGRCGWCEKKRHMPGCLSEKVRVALDREGELKGGVDA